MRYKSRSVARPFGSYLTFAPFARFNHLSFVTMADEVVLLDFWPSVYGTRVKIVLAEKGINYEYKEQNLGKHKSHLLLQMNPIHKKIPVLIHNGKPLCESLVIHARELMLGSGLILLIKRSCSDHTYSWFYAFEMFGKFSIGEECPKIIAWAKRCMQKDSVAKSLPHQKKIYEFFVQLRKTLGLNYSN
nr:glutathione s-transferase u24 [Quercus suber]